MHFSLQTVSIVAALLSVVTAGPIPTPVRNAACVGPTDCTPPTKIEAWLAPETLAIEKRTACVGGKCTIPPVQKRALIPCTGDECPPPDWKREALPCMLQDDGSCIPDSAKKREALPCTMQDDGTCIPDSAKKREAAPVPEPKVCPICVVEEGCPPCGPRMEQREAQPEEQPEIQELKVRMSAGPCPPCSEDWCPPCTMAPEKREAAPLRAAGPCNDIDCPPPTLPTEKREADAEALRSSVACPPCSDENCPPCGGTGGGRGPVKREAEPTVCGPKGCVGEPRIE